MPKSLYILAAFFLVATLAAAVLLLQEDEEALEASLAVADALASDTTGYDRAVAPRDLTFPEDHGPHPGFKIEWWYFTGNVETEEGRPFGYQFTLFRNALTPPGAGGPDTVRSAWATNQLYMGHFALTDVESEQFYAFERFSRAGARLAGAQAEPFRVWLENWEMVSQGGSFVPLTIRAAQEEVAIILQVDEGKPIVLQGDRGLSRKGAGEGNASYYYSITRLPTQGTIRIGDQTYAVRGTSWLDREWSTSVLGEEQVGWDWFSLQLTNGYDLMYYRIREADGTASRYTEGVLVGPDGQKTRLSQDEVQLEPLAYWESPRGGRYPVRWRLRVPSRAIDLTVTPYLRNQELDVSVRYWEGAMQVEGSFGGQPVSGSGYLEMTGYSDQAGQPLS